VALIASDIWAARVSGNALSLDDGLDAARERSIGPFRRGVEGGMLAPELPHALGRGWELFHNLLPSVAPSFFDRFRAATGMTTEEYYVCCCAVMTEFMRPGSEATIFDANALGSTTLDRPLVQGFVALESQTVEELRRALWGNAELNEILNGQLPTYDYKPMREKPLLRAADGRTIIIDPIFMADKAAVGPLFHVLRTCAARQDNDLFAAFGKAFERYVQDILRRSFPKPGADLFDPLTCRLEGRSSSGEQFELDACLNYITDLVLFEIKAAWPREPEFLPENAQTLLSSLRRQYGVSEKGKKGAGQLARVSHAISTGRWLGPRGEFCKVRRIAPVLVVHDSLLSAPGFGSLVTGEFDRELRQQRELQTAGPLRRHVQVLAPIVITVADLEILEVSLEHFGFREVLTDYSEAHGDRMTSFHDFLASSPKYQQQIYANRHLASVALQPLMSAMQRLFGRCVD
jgi:hypothetical protein